MEVIKREKKFCISCMEEHEVQLVRVLENTVFKDKPLEYYVVYEYCEKSEEFWETEEYITQNNIAMKDAYRDSMGLLTSQKIADLRKKYSISQTDLSTLLGWGAKTITRYESTQVQDAAHDTILRKLSSDPEWFMSLLMENKDKFKEDAYNKYFAAASQLFESSQDTYLRKSIQAQYARYNSDINICGNRMLNLDKVVDVVRYYSNSKKVTNLFKVKLMKLMWYADALSYKRRSYSITGLAYTALQMGAVPVAHKLLVDLKGINYEEKDFSNGIGLEFIPDNNNEYKYLDAEDKKILDDVIDVLGKYSKDQLVSKMHSERAYTETAAGDIIQYQYANNLSFS